MAQIFLQVINMSVTASIVILAVCFGRGILKQAPKILSYALWLVVLIRLVCPAAVATPGNDTGRNNGRSDICITEGCSQG